MNGTPIPNAAELPILAALWALGTATSAQVGTALAAAHFGYSDPYNMACAYLHRMAHRGLVTRHAGHNGEGRRPYYYTATHSREALAALMLGDD